MKLPADAIIAFDKVANYLLKWRPENDKSQFLARAGYTEHDAARLVDDIRRELLTLEAGHKETTEYGEMYGIVGKLAGPNGRVLPVVSIWMIEHVTKKGQIHYALSCERKLAWPINYSPELRRRKTCPRLACGEAM